MTTAWSHLPNAAHIDAVIASVAAHPAQWRAAWAGVWVSPWNPLADLSRQAMQSRAYQAMIVAERGREAEWFAVADEVWDAARNAAYDAAWNAVLALVAYDDCAYLLSMPLDQVQVLAALELPAAVLLLPAVVAFQSIKELSYE